jgi:hypothetical protein
MPKLYVLTVLETAMERIVSGAGPREKLSVACKYHVHGRSGKCYKSISRRRQQEAKAQPENVVQEEMAKEKRDTTLQNPDIASKALVGTAEAVRIIKVTGKKVDNASINSMASSFRTTVGEVEIKRNNTASKRNVSTPALSRDTWKTSNKSSLLEQELMGYAPAEDRAKRSDTTTLNEQTAEASKPDSIENRIDCAETETPGEQVTRSPSPEDGNQESSGASVYTTAETTIDTPPWPEPQVPLPGLVSRRSQSRRPVRSSRASSQASMSRVFALPGAFPNSHVST